jgi:hypothetical protein
MTKATKIDRWTCATQRDVARACGVTARTVGEWATRDDFPGLPAPVAAFVRWLTRRQVPDADLANRIKRATARKIEEQASAAEFDNAIRRAEYIRLDEAARQIAEHVAFSRSHVERIPEEIGLLVPTDLRPIVQEEASRKVRAILTELAEACEKAARPGVES